MQDLEKNLPGNISGKYLTFNLAKETYGIEILKVREIIGMIEITPLPQTPNFVKGLINLRGKVIAVIDLRTKFGLEEKPYSNETCMIIADLVEKQIGLIIDSVCEVIDIPDSSVEKTPSFGSQINTAFIKGIGKVDKQVIILLDIEKVLNSEELVKVQSLM
ncbi:MAG: purine-binding chemotaxis protein CheW [Candidatus Brocadiae bacterium]|nr:purine-binding chemotaxis protein CheW [Candidatus Brocadiia bacterium]